MFYYYLPSDFFSERDCHDTQRHGARQSEEYVPMIIPIQIGIEKLSIEVTPLTAATIEMMIIVATVVIVVLKERDIDCVVL